MTRLKTRIRWFGAGLLASWLAVSPAMGDDTELFTGGQGFNSDVRPNVLFILDTSGSMAEEVVTQENYDPGIAYPGIFQAGRVYWREGTGNPPCAKPIRIGQFTIDACVFGIFPPAFGLEVTDQWFNETALRCDAAVQAFAVQGYHVDRAGQYEPSPRRWRRIRSNQKNRLVECQDDGGIHGGSAGGSDVWARNGVANQPWDDDDDNEIDWTPGGGNGVREYTMYHANWLNWFWFDASARMSKLEIMQNVSTALLDSITGVNVGLMRFSNNGGTNHELSAQGGMVVWAMEDIETAREGIKAKINSFTAAGNTPLAETLYEAGQYWVGRNVDYGLNSKPEPSISSSRVTGNQGVYKAPATFACQKNFNVLLTDGLPTADRHSENKTEALPGFRTLVGSDCDDSGDGECLDDMAEYLFETDISSSLDGQQNVITYTVGFDVDFPLLDSTAQRGGGEYFTADDTSSLQVALTDIIRRIQEVNTTFTSPTVSVNAFNRTQNLNDLFVTVFRPSENTHWPGNVKKYRLVDGVIVDQFGNPAVDPSTGFFATGAQSFWTDDDPDGARVDLGGAAFELPAPSSRNLYTFTGGTSDLANGNNALAVGNPNLTDAMLGLGSAGDPSRDELINWTRGEDILDDDHNPATTVRHDMGDPLHAKPVTVIYGGTPASPDIDDAVIFATTNDGFLHAIDPNDGGELWAFVPQELLPELKTLMDDPATADKHYGLDGNLRSLIVDEDRNGIVNGNDKVYLYFGMRRGGDSYYALDVTDKSSPKLLWVKDVDDYPGLGQTWSTPLPTRVDVSGVTYPADNDEKFVLVFGGGYDGSQDNEGYSTDGVGNGIYMVDAVSGALLWRAGGTGSGADRIVDDMKNSIPGDIRAIDLNQDGFADRMYAADMGGRVFRFDIFNGEDPGDLVTGGLFANLGAGDPDLGASPPLSENRRFYNAPDVSLVNSPHSGAPPFLNIAIGSGYRAHPLSTGTQDRFYSLRDPTVFPKLSQTEFDALTPIEDEDLDDVTTIANPVIPPDSRGWKIDMATGEKVLAEARTFANQVFFTTLTPKGPSETNPCLPQSQNRLYVVDVLDGSPVTNFDDPADTDNLTVENRGRNLEQDGIAPEVVFLFPEYDPTACEEGEVCEPPPPECLVGVEKCAPDFTNAPVRTFWRQDGTE